MRGILAVVLLTGCASAIEPAPRYEALVCNPAAADHVAFGVQDAGAFFAPPGEAPYGSRFLIIDGSCRYWVMDRDVDPVAWWGRVQTGMLTEDELNALNSELLTGPWALLDGEHLDITGADAPTLSLWRDALGASCYAGCDERASAELLATFETAWDWTHRLAERATPVEGSVQLVVQPTAPGDPSAIELTHADLTGTPLLRAFFRSVVEDPTEAALLRARRDESGMVTIRIGDDYFAGAAVDVIPHADESGVLRPPFPIRE